MKRCHWTSAANDYFWRFHGERGSYSTSYSGYAKINIYPTINWREGQDWPAVASLDLTACHQLNLSSTLWSSCAIFNPAISPMLSSSLFRCPPFLCLPVTISDRMSWPIPFNKDSCLLFGGNEWGCFAHLRQKPSICQIFVPTLQSAILVRSTRTTWMAKNGNSRTTTQAA